MGKFGDFLAINIKDRFWGTFFLDRKTCYQQNSKTWSQCIQGNM